MATLWDNAIRVLQHAGSAKAILGVIVVRVIVVVMEAVGMARAWWHYWAIMQGTA